MAAGRDFVRVETKVPFPIHAALARLNIKSAIAGLPDKQSSLNILAWCWAKGDERHLIINYRQEAAQAHVQVPWDELRGKAWRLSDVLSGESHDRSGDEMRKAGLYVDLGSWQCHLFQVRAL